MQEILPKTSKTNVTFINLTEFKTLFQFGDYYGHSGTLSPDLGFGRNPKGIFPKYNALIIFDGSKFLILYPEVNKCHGL